MKPTSSPKPNRKTSKDKRTELEDEIRRRAYELFLERNGREGEPELDWLRAEAEILERRARLGTSS